MYSPGIRSTIGGSAHPFQNEDPLGKAFADWFETTGQQALTGSMKAVGDWYQKASADQTGRVDDDLLRLIAGGVKNTTNAWKAATAEQEGIHDDILRGAAWTAGKGMQALDAGSYYGGQLGGNIARMVGVDARIGGALGNVAGDVLLGGAVAKAAQVGKTTSRLRKLRALDTPEMWIEGAAKGLYALAHGEKPAGLIDDFATAVTATGKQHKRVKALTKAELVRQLPSSYNVTGKKGKALVEKNFRDWLEVELKKVGGDVKKIDRSQFAPGGIIRDGQPQGITGLKKGKPTLYNLGPLEARAYQLNPSNFPEVEKVFTRGHEAWRLSGGTEGLNPAITFEAFKKEAIRTANLQDKLTKRLTKAWNLKEPTKGMVGNIPIDIDGKTAEIRRALEINKGHMKSAGLRGTDMGMSQLVELAAYNKSMGKIDSFDRRVMDVLGLPSAGKSIPKNFKPKSPQVAAKLAQREQYGWIQAATQFAADSKVKTKLVKGKLVQTLELEDSREAILGMAEKLALQKTRLNKPIKRKGVFAQATGGQEAAAQAAVARRQLINEYFKAGLADDDNGLEILKQLLEKTSTEEQIKKALYISPEGQIKRAGRKNPMTRREDLQIADLYGPTVQTGKTTQVKRTIGLPSGRGSKVVLPSEATGFPTGATKDDILKIRLEELRRHYNQTGSVKVR